MLFAVAAGALTTLSPCTLPILPILFGAALAQHRWAPAALAASVALSFTALGLFVATLGFSLGLDAGVFRDIAAIVLLGFGVILIVPPLESRFAGTASGLGAGLARVAAALSIDGVRGQFLLGLVLGAAWAPCAGPTLGAATLLAAQRRDLADVAATMLAFGLGASLPLAALGALSGRLAARRRRALAAFARQGKTVLGAVATLAGLMIVSGLDRSFEAFLVTASPAWLTALTTRL